MGRSVFNSFWIIILLCEALLEIGESSRVKPEKIDDENCGKIEKRRTCTLESVNGTWQGTKIYEYPKKFVLLWPMPNGNFENARRVCEACNMEVAEIWDEDDHEQILDLIKNKYKMDSSGKFSNASFWLGAVSNRESDKANYKWTYQDGTTSVRFHHLRLPESWAVNPSAVSSGLPDKLRDCMVIGPNAKDPKKILWTIQSCDSISYYTVCQFKRKYSCNDAADSVPFLQINYTVKGAEKSVPKPQPYYISSYPLSWRLAKMVCEEKNKSLLFLQNEDEHKRFRKVFLSYLADKPQYFHTGFWIAAKFHGKTQYEKLAWRIQEDQIEIENWKQPKSGGISKTWGIDPYSSDKTKEPHDASKSGKDENCVYVKYFHNNQQATTWYTADCDKTPNFFVCRDDAMYSEQRSSVEYCDSSKYVKREEKDCKWNLMLQKQKPDCVCTKGIHGLTDHQNCNSRLLVGERCIKLSSKGVLHWKILNPEIISDKSWLVAQSRNRKAGRFIEWFSMKMNSSRQLFGNSNIYYSGLKVTQIGKSGYCFQPSGSGDKSDEFHEIKIRNETSKVSFKDKCEEPGTEVKARKHKVGKTAMNECTLKPCKRPAVDTVEANPFQKECTSGADADDKCEYKEILKRHDAETTTIRPEVTAAPELRSKNIDVNQQMLMHAIDTSFYNSTSSVHIDVSKPERSWAILQTLFTIAKDVCSCMVPDSFFDNVLKMFKVAHFGQAYEYTNFFSQSEASQISKMLSECRNSIGHDNTLICEKNTCNNRVNKVNYVKTNGEIVEKYLDDTGYQGIQHHHVMEGVFNVIDIWNVVCIKQFRPSYLLYHHLEQGMEALFTDELRKLWHYPNVDENFYKKLLGPMESTYLQNLHQCASAVYGINNKVLRLGRPIVPPIKILGQRIRERKTKERLIATGYSDGDNELTEPSNENATAEANNNKNKASSVFCSRDQYCMKW